jgi:carbonic anhydrase/acetyltransferase-like protein (isoleucine patch superfamily)
MGAPGKVRRAAEERDLARIHHAAEHYVESARIYREQFGGNVGGGPS